MRARQSNPKWHLPKLYADIRGQILTIGAASLLIIAPVSAAETKSNLLSGKVGDERLKPSLSRGIGVWLTRTYDVAWPRPGFAETNWHDPPDTPHGGNVRTRDLHLPRAIEHAPAKTLFCMVLVDGTFEQLGECASANPDGTFTVAASTLRQLDFDRYGLAVIVLRDEGYAHVRRDGRALVVPTFDNGPDEFIGGLVRVKIGDKFGFANRRLKLVIPADYDGAYRFIGKRAWACTGCVLTSDGEHSWFSGGEAVCLDQRGRQRPTPECEQAGWLRTQLRE